VRLGRDAASRTHPIFLWLRPQPRTAGSKRSFFYLPIHGSSVTSNHIFTNFETLTIRIFTIHHQFTHIIFLCTWLNALFSHHIITIFSRLNTLPVSCQLGKISCTQSCMHVYMSKTSPARPGPIGFGLPTNLTRQAWAKI
jgi:hypothetical protein